MCIEKRLVIKGWKGWGTGNRNDRGGIRTHGQSLKRRLLYPWATRSSYSRHHWATWAWTQFIIVCQERFWSAAARNLCPKCIKCISVSGVSGVSAKFESKWLTVSGVSGVSGVWVFQQGLWIIPQLISCWEGTGELDGEGRQTVAWWQQSGPTLSWFRVYARVLANSE